MESLDFTKPSHSEIYDPEAAIAFFKSAGKVENVAAGATFFVEKQHRGFFVKDDRMYLLLEGAVALTVGRKTIDIIKPGEIFGEIATICHSPRSATAVAKTACRVVSLDPSQLEKAITKTPAFALMLMSILINRLRLTVSVLSMSNALPAGVADNQCRVFDQAALADLARELGDPVPLRIPANSVVLKEGEPGIRMYVVLEGTVVVSVKGKALERIAPGGAFGEMSLVDSGVRAASAVAETHCSLMAINRETFLTFVKTKPGFAMSLLKLLGERLKHVTTYLA
jgi:CRP/FNR family transcriptional regulator, cyclic AMP receptor protein